MINLPMVITLGVLSLVQIASANAAGNRPMLEFSKHWSCDFKNEPRINKFNQGIVCSIEELCVSPKQAKSVTYTDLDQFQINFEKKSISYIESVQLFSSVRENYRAQQKALGRKDESGKLEYKRQHTYRIRDIHYSKADAELIPEITTITYLGDFEKIALLTVIANGKKAIISMPIAFSDSISVVHYFGSCQPR